MMYRNTCMPVEKLVLLDDREKLLHFGYKPHQIIQLSDGSAILDLDQIRLDLQCRKAL